MANSTQHNHLPEIFSCKMCNYYTCDKKQYNKHFLSTKHLKTCSTPTPDPVAESQPPPPSLHVKPAHKLSLQLVLPDPPPNTPTAILCKVCNKTYKYQKAFVHHRCKNQPVVSPLEEEPLELISDDDDDDDDVEEVEEDPYNNEFEYMHIDPLIMNHDVMYFMEAFMRSMDFIKNIFIYINRVFKFFPFKSNEDCD
jgi:hypothetical protein